MRKPKVGLLPLYLELYDNAMPDAELEPLVRDAAKHETQAGFRWYSRLRMWDFAARRITGALGWGGIGVALGSQSPPK